VAKKKAEGAERRVFPRRDTEVKVRLAAVQDRQLVFEAHLDCRDVSIGGMFLQSNFFIKMGTLLDVEFELKGSAEPVRLQGVVIREQRHTGTLSKLRSGFAIQFTEYLDDAKLALAGFFLAPEVQKFVRRYQRSQSRGRGRVDEQQSVDLILAWELHRQEEGKGNIKI